MAELNFEQDIEIDATALDIELLRQPTIFYRYSKHESEMKKEMALAHERLKTVRSELVREAGTNKDIKNATQIEAFYRNDTGYQEAKQELVEAEYEANMASNAVWAMNQRKNSLENLVRLCLSDYFARPTEPRDIEKEVDLVKQRDEKTATSRKRTQNKMTRKRK